MIINGYVEGAYKTKEITALLIIINTFCTVLTVGYNFAPHLQVKVKRLDEFVEYCKFDWSSNELPIKATQFVHLFMNNSAGDLIVADAERHLYLFDGSNRSRFSA